MTFNYLYTYMIKPLFENIIIKDFLDYKGYSIKSFDSDKNCIFFIRNGKRYYYIDDDFAVEVIPYYDDSRVSFKSEFSHLLLVRNFLEIRVDGYLSKYVMNRHYTERKPSCLFEEGDREVEDKSLFFGYSMLDFLDWGDEFLHFQNIKDEFFGEVIFLMKQEFFERHILKKFYKLFKDYYFLGDTYVDSKYNFDYIFQSHDIFDRCKIYQIRLDDINNNVLVFSIKKNKDKSYKLIIKCKKLLSKNFNSCLPTLKKLEVDLPKPEPHPGYFSRCELIDETYLKTDIEYFYSNTLPELIFGNYIFEDGSSLYKHYLDFINGKERDKIIELERRNKVIIEEQYRKYLERQKKLEEEQIKLDKKIDELMGEEVF